MIQDKIVSFFVLCFHLVVHIVESAIGFVVVILGPGLTALMITAAILWYFGLIDSFWNAAASLVA